MENATRSRVSARASHIAVSAIKDMAMRAAKIPEVASLTWGVPSFRTPPHIREAVQVAMARDADFGKYTLPDGLAEVRNAVAAAHHAATGVSVCPDKRVLMTAGNMEGVKVVLDAVVDPGDEVIVADPGFPSHIHQIRLCGGEPVFWPLDSTRGWSMDLDALERLMTARTRAILLVSPSNPTGTIYAKAELLRVAQLARKRGLLVIIDDPYSHFVFDTSGAWFNLAAVPEFAEQIVYLFTFSKCHAMSGWRLGYAVLPEDLKKQVLKVHDATVICAPRPSQIAGLAALTGDGSHLQEFRGTLMRRRDLICDRLDRVPHVFSYERPNAAYYVFPRIEVAHDTSMTFAIDLLEQAKVCVTPGAAFGPSGEGHVRMAFCVSEDEINTAFDRIEQLHPA